VQQTQVAPSISTPLSAAHGVSLREPALIEKMLKFSMLYRMFGVDRSLGSAVIQSMDGKKLIKIREIRKIHECLE
jgi:hypothetical protein